ncbi:hypothetical protein NDU88_000590 [Pleurodeles waltl]|uniref:Uncharacterized protein n=1 Tax=Pleurodeles waltl TaxID=8319 RepID=A0AAV7S7L8_PLEWA|nr:hypothetical protein NDU88_000590 [Pleurodeles waltl]
MLACWFGRRRAEEPTGERTTETGGEHEGAVAGDVWNSGKEGGSEDPTPSRAAGAAEERRGRACCRPRPRTQGAGRTSGRGGPRLQPEVCARERSRAGRGAGRQTWRPVTAPGGVWPGAELRLGAIRRRGRVAALRRARSRWRCRGGGTARNTWAEYLGGPSWGPLIENTRQHPVEDGEGCDRGGPRRVNERRLSGWAMWAERARGNWLMLWCPAI